MDDAYGGTPTFGGPGWPKVNAHPAPRPQHRQGEHQANEDRPHLLILADWETPGLPGSPMCCNTEVSDAPSELSIERTSDATLVANVHFCTVLIAYKRFFPPESPAPTIQELSIVWKERLADPSTMGFAASLNGHTVGMAVVRRDPDFDPEGQLLGLHVLPDVWGRGIGNALHDRAVETLETSCMTVRAYGRSQRTRGHVECTRDEVGYVFLESN